MLWNNCYNYSLNKFLNCRTSQSLHCPNVHCESGIWSFRIIQDSFSLGTSFPGFSDQGALWQTVLQDLSSLILSGAFSCIHSACLLHSCLYLLSCQRHWGLPKDADFTFAKALPSASSYCCVGPLPLTQRHLGWRELAKQQVSAICGGFEALGTFGASTELVINFSDPGWWCAVLQQLSVAVSLQRSGIRGGQNCVCRHACPLLLLALICKGQGGSGGREHVADCWEQRILCTGSECCKDWLFGAAGVEGIALLISASCVLFLPSNAFVSLPSHRKAARGPHASLDLLSSLGCFWEGQSVLPAQGCLT